VISIPVRTGRPLTFSNKSLHGKICLSPFNSVHINVNGDVNICLCPGWQPTVVGNILQQSLKEILRSPTAVAIRQSIIDGSYSFCDETRCPILINNQLNSVDNVPPTVKQQLADSKIHSLPNTIAFNIDSTCNLSCPSCRTKIIKTEEEDVEKRTNIGRKVFDNLLEPTDQPIELIVSGAGEVFASPMIMQVLEQLTLDQFPNLKLNIHTNGLLAPSRWKKIEHLESAINLVTVSIDACSANTYEKIRRGGTWQDLLIAMQFLHSKKSQLNFQFRTRMIVQAGNYQEAENFHKFCQQFEVDRVEYSRLTDWGTWARVEFLQHDVFDQQHPDRPQAIDVIEKIKTLPNVWFEGNFS
jgi:MoaA/NifB/PqqE/SkfB family radical SAM enzyme